MKLTHKIFLGFGAVVLMAGVIGAFGWQGMGALSGYLGAQARLGEVSTTAARTGALIEKGAIANHSAALEEAQSEIDRLDAELDALIASGLAASSADGLSAARDALPAFKETVAEMGAGVAAFRTEQTALRTQTADLEDMVARLQQTALANKETAEATLSRIREDRATRQEVLSQAQALGGHLAQMQIHQLAYKDTRLETDKAEAEEEMKALFIAGLKLKKSTTGTEEEKPATILLKVFTDLRRGFQEVTSSGFVAQETQEAFTGTVNKARAFTSSIIRRQEKAFGAMQEEESLAFEANGRAIDLMTAANRIGAQTAELQRNVFRVTESADQAAGALETVRSVVQDVMQQAGAAEALADADAVREISEGVRANMAAFESGFAAFSAAAVSKDRLAASGQASLGELRGLLSEVLGRIGGEIEAAQAREQALILAVLAAILALGAGLAVVLGRTISRPIGVMSAVMDRMRAG
ncbi:MAG: hypothetical protein NXI21_19330, partial [Alphaproteobacteria bacterium]|nr:hypothetical protein [Alphaproteobacteria bacterium]